MQDNDILCRLAIFPKFTLQNEINESVFDRENLLGFTSFSKKNTNNGKTVKYKYATSVISKFIMETENKIHEYGVTVADNMSNRAKSESAKEVIYLGYYEMKKIDVISVSLKYYLIEIKYLKEFNCDAHFQLELWLKNEDNDIPKKSLAEERRKFCFIIFEKLVGPIKTNIGPALEREELFMFLPRVPRSS